MAGVERIELPSKVLETSVLPLNHTPKIQLEIGGVQIPYDFKLEFFYGDSYGI